MDLHQIKEHLQCHLSDGLVIIVGSGLSCAEGIPGMEALADQLVGEMPALVNENDKEQWCEVESLLKSGIDLETALLSVKVSTDLESAIVEVTHSFISSYERDIVAEVLNNGRVLRFSRLLPHLLKPNSGIPVITTNYDRLIEIATETIGLAVNNTFSGRYVSSFSPQESLLGLCRKLVQRSKRVILGYAEFVSVYKPHGSLDWFLLNGEPICTALFSPKDKLIITPGENKYKEGYERPFDTHRELANKAIDQGSRYLIIGYGFNDDHLQVHLERQLEKGKNTVVLTHTVSKEFREYVKDKENIWVICSRPGLSGFKLLRGEAEHDFDDCDIWDLEIFVSEVLE